MRINRRGRLQKAVLWVANGLDEHGEVKVDAARQIDVRWEEVQHDTTDARGKLVTADVGVVVDEDLVVGSIMWLGRLNDVADPPVRLYEIVSFSKSPVTNRGSEFLRIASLKRHSDELPALAG